MHETTGRAIFDAYVASEGLYDEVFDDKGKVRKHYRRIFNYFKNFSDEEFNTLNESAKLSFLNQGITFATYSENNKGVERIFPFDLYPRIIPSDEWNTLSRGVVQRNIAINHFLYDLYHDKKILKDKVVPAELVFSSANYNKFMLDFEPPGGIYNHISGTDIIRHKDGLYYVLEDNVRCPSGVSYVLGNREAMKKTLSGLFQKSMVRTVVEYPEELLKMMQSVAPDGIDEPCCAVLTPGIYNSAYYEHSFLAQSMGVELVESRDLFVEKGFVYMKTIYGPKKVDVIYRRVDDEFLDPLTFNPDSVLGVAGLMSVYREGNITIINAPGTGVSDDKAVYCYVPDIIRYYLSEEPIISNVPTYRCENEKDRKYVLDHVEELVIKPVDQSGGYGIVFGGIASREEKEEIKRKIKTTPREYVAQPVMSLTTHATYIEDTTTCEPRHIDLRTFALMGKDHQYVLNGGLTRVALRKGSLVVNSSQGGGSKDTWIID
ncbi:MAG: circularly permuted type 2 ATP-grasp protein [Cyclobacteriaceae bacterium]|nr:circularly permuted type 2 ATP-grasp protein [Cyclobacteriaceae bacterium]